MAPTLATLPMEMTTAIVKGVDDQNSLLRLMQTSHYFHDFTLPHLYHNVTFGRYRDRESNVAYAHAYSFACRVLSNPELAALVRCISIVERKSTRNPPTATSVKLRPTINGRKESKGNTCARPKYGIPASALDKSILRVISLNQNKRDAAAWIKAFARCYQSEVAIAVTLPFLPNLKCWKGPVAKITAPFCTEMLACARPTDFGFPKSSFQALTKIAIRKSSEFSCIGEEELTFLLKIPTLLEVSADTFWHSSSVDFCSSDMARSLTEGSSSVISLSLKDLKMSPYNVGFFVTACRKLRTLKLTWRHGHIFWCPGAGAIGSMEALNAFLPSVSSTCEILTLEYLRGYWTTHCTAIQIQEPLLPLVEFSRLRRLKLGMTFVFGVQYHLFRNWKLDDRVGPRTVPDVEYLVRLLPPNVETLVLVRYETEDIDLLFRNIETLLSAIADKRFLSLRSIEVEDRIDIFIGNFAKDYVRTIGMLEKCAGDFDIVFRFQTSKSLDF